MEFINKNVERDVMYTGYHSYHEHHGARLNKPIVNGQPYMMGVELETVFPDSEDRNDWCDEVQSNWFYMERDGSLPGGGCEIISTPLAPKDAKNPSTWYPLVKALRDAGARSCKDRTTGLHVHISKEVFGSSAQAQSDGIGRLLYFYYYVLSEDTREAVFARRSSSYAHDLDKRYATKTAAADTLKVALKYKDVRDEVGKELSSLVRRDRYHSINIDPNNPTIEFRQGKGSINNRRIAAICEFVEACCLYVKRNTDYTEYSEARFLETLKEDGVCKTYYFDEEK